jgi:hypothetical protein
MTNTRVRHQMKTQRGAVINSPPSALPSIATEER